MMYAKIKEFILDFFTSRRFLYSALILVLGAGLLYAVSSFQGFRDTLVKELRDSGETLDRLKQNMDLLSQDTNELRGVLGLSPRTYPPLEDKEKIGSTPDGEERSADHVLFYRAVEGLLGHTERTRLEKGFYEIIDSREIKEALKKNGLLINRNDGRIALEKQRKPYFNFTMKAEDPPYRIVTFTGKFFGFSRLSPELAAFIDLETRAITEHYALVGKKILQIAEIAGSAEITGKTKEMDLAIGQGIETPEAFTLSIYLPSNKGEAKLKIGLDKKSGSFFIGPERLFDPGEFRNKIIEALGSLDLRTPEQVIIEKLTKRIHNLSGDRGFVNYLKSKKLRLSLDSREDDEYIHFDFISNEEKRAGSLGIQKSHGEIYLFDEEYVSLGALKTFGFGQKTDVKKKIEYPDRLPLRAEIPDDRFSRTFLIAGAHEKMTDAIILVTVNEKSKDISLISIPRDVFFHGRKINGLYYRYGSGRFVDEIAGLTGLKIEKYVIIDMFAFIDAVNILGGIEVSLEEDLVDPTYRIRDEGRWSTLFYPAGTHRLSGIEALRVARSRHFTSDFGRAKRQQLILEGIKEKLSGLGFGEIGKMYDLVQILVKYVETNFTPFEIVNYISKYKDLKLKSQTVLDTTNILYHAYTNLKHLNLTEEDIAADFDKGAYILLPKNDDWNLVRRFIRYTIDGGDA
jgi:LCP family protein required for cell wall assembly